MGGVEQPARTITREGQQLAAILGAPFVVDRIVFLQPGRGIRVAEAGGIRRQADLAAAAEVELEAAEDRGGAGQIDGDLADGLLIIDLVREVPDAMKPRKIAIGGTATLTAVPMTDSDDAASAA